MLSDTLFKLFFYYIHETTVVCLGTIIETTFSQLLMNIDAVPQYRSADEIIRSNMTNMKTKRLAKLRAYNFELHVRDAIHHVKEKNIFLLIYIYIAEHRSAHNLFRICSEKLFGI